MFQSVSYPPIARFRKRFVVSLSCPLPWLTFYLCVWVSSSDSRKVDLYKTWLRYIYLFTELKLCKQFYILLRLSETFQNKFEMPWLKIGTAISMCKAAAFTVLQKKRALFFLRVRITVLFFSFAEHFFCILRPRVRSKVMNVTKQLYFSKSCFVSLRSLQKKTWIHLPDL